MTMPQVNNVQQKARSTGTYDAVLIAIAIAATAVAVLINVIIFISLPRSLLTARIVILCAILFTLLALLSLVILYRCFRKASQTQQKLDAVQHKSLNLNIIQQEAGNTGTYGAALIGTASMVPVIAALMSVVFFIVLPQFSWSKLIAPLGGTVLTLIFWLLLAIPYRRFTAVDLANASSYELLINRLYQIEAWFAILEPEPKPKTNSVYAICKQEIRSSCDAIYQGLITKSASWILATGYVNMWRLVHRADEAYIDIEPVEAVIQDALHDEMSLQNSKLKNKEDLLKKLRNAVKILDRRAITYLSQQPPQEDEAEIGSPNANNGGHGHSKPVPGQQLNQNNVKPENHSDTFSDDINIKTQARTIIREVRCSLHQFRDDRWEKLVRVRNLLIRMTILTGIVLYVLLEFAILADVEVQTLKAAAFFYLIGAIVGLFSRLYDQAKIDISIDDFRLAAVRLIAAPLYSGLAAIGGVVIVQRAILTNATMFDLNLTNILIAAVFGLTPSLFTNAMQKEADQYKTDLKSTSSRFAHFYGGSEESSHSLE